MMDKKEFIHSVKFYIQKVLNKVFYDDNGKRHLKVKYSAINHACPYCHDSATDSTKKRGNFILAGPCAGFYKCFNCGRFTNGNQFFKDFGIELPSDTVDYINGLVEVFNANNPQSNAKKFDLTAFTNPGIYKSRQKQKNIDLSLIDLIYDYEEVDKYAVSKDLLYNNRKFQIIPIHQSPEGLSYLRSRNQDYPVNYQKFGYIPSKDAIAIYNLTMDDKVLGFQYRYIHPNGKSRFWTYKAGRIWEELLEVNKKVPEAIEGISTMFNIMLVDFNTPVICLEGPMDSMLIPNSIATGSASIDPPDILEPYYYMYDSDHTGNKEAMQKLNKGEYVFLWSKLKEDLGLPNRTKWDWNDVHNYLKDHGKRPPKNLLDYFSDNKLDAMLI